MKVFISWSGARSEALAQSLRDWLPLVLHFVEPWLSKSDIDAGERWANEVAKELEASNFGIICISRENINSPWILFEAGALAKSLQEGRVVPLLLDIEFKDIAGPLAQFQAKKVEKAGLTDLTTSINRFAEPSVPDARLNQLFEALWPEFEKKVSSIPKTQAPAKQNRPQHEILEELVTSVRGLDSRVHEVTDGASRGRRRRYRFHPSHLEEIMGRGFGPDDPLRLLLLASYLKDDLPWIYELAIEAYHAFSGNDPHRDSIARGRLKAAFQMLRESPIIDMLGGDKEVHFIVHEIGRAIEHLLHRPRLRRRPAKNGPQAGAEAT